MARFAALRMVFGFVLGASFLTSVGACGYVRITRTPMASLAFAGAGVDKARGAIVLLPGFGDRPTTFEQQGFVTALKEAAPGYDVYAADAHFGYYRTGTLIERLDTDVIGPLRARGYKELWIAGTSLGGHGAVGYAREHPDRIAGLMLFAPYMGPRGVVDEVRRAGGLCRYQGSEDPPKDAETFARANLTWLRRAVCEEKRVQVWLAVGEADHLLAADRVLGDALDPSHVLVRPGGHGWKVWTPAVAELGPRAFAATTTGVISVGAAMPPVSPQAPR